MRVLVSGPSFSVHTQKLVNMLIDEGCSVTLADTFQPPSSAAFKGQFIKFKPIPARGQRFEWLRKLRGMMEVCRARSLWRRVKPDITHVHWIDERAASWVKAGCKPLVLTAWGSDINRFFGNPQPDAKIRARIGRALASAEAVTADSMQVFERCEILAGRQLRKLLFHFGVDASVFRRGYESEAAALRARLGIPAGAKIILSCRRLQPGLGQEYILEAVSRLIRDPNVPDLVLLLKRYLSDSDGAYERKLLRAAGQMKLSNRVFFLDEAPYEQVPVHYAMADVVVNYPDRDAAPVSLFEAAACERMIVTSDLPAYREVFDDALTMVPFGRPELLAKAIETALAGNTASNAAAVRSALAIARETGDAKSNCLRLIALFNELVEAGEGRCPAQS